MNNLAYDDDIFAERQQTSLSFSYSLYHKMVESGDPAIQIFR